MILNALRSFRSTVLEAALREYLRVNTNKAVTNGPLTWDHHGVAARTSTHWMNDAKWKSAYEQSWCELEALGLTYYKYGAPNRAVKRDLFRNEWNIHVAAWAAQCAMSVPGDFVELGAGAGIFSRCIMRYVDFDASVKTFWLVDRWSGESRRTTSFIEDFATAEKLFAPYKRARLVRGSVPQVLPSLPETPIAYLYVDLNAAEPELAALEYLYPRLSSGAFVLSDDFGFRGHEPQLHAFRAFCTGHGMPLLYSPTGQGVAIKL